MGLPPEMHQCLSWTSHWTRHVPLCRERSPRRNLNGQSASRRRQQPVHGKLQQRRADEFYSISWCEQFIRVGHESVPSNRWFPVGKSCVCGIAIVFVETSVYIILRWFHAVSSGVGGRWLHKLPDQAKTEYCWSREKRRAGRTGRDRYREEIIKLNRRRLV